MLYGGFYCIHGVAQASPISNSRTFFITQRNLAPISSHSVFRFFQCTSPSYEYLGLISFRMDWLDLLAVQGTLKSLLQHHNSKASILQHLAFLRSNPHITIGKTIALTIWTFIGKVMSLLFNMLSRLVIAFLQGASIFYFHGCIHHLRQFCSPLK